MKVIFYMFILSLSFSFDVGAGTISIDGEELRTGSIAIGKNCLRENINVFGSDASNTIVTEENVYSGSKSLKLTIDKGTRGFGAFGGIINLSQCMLDTPKLYKGDEIWVRLRMFVPEDFKFKDTQRHKFLRFRTFHFDDDNKLVSDGYNDIYLNAMNLENAFSQPYNYIFEGQQKWFKFGKPIDFIEKGKWETFEFYLKLDNKNSSDGGDSIVRFWKNGKLLGETTQRRTLKYPKSFLRDFYLFTYWGNEKAKYTQSLYVDDLIITTDQPVDSDQDGNRMIGLGDGYVIKSSSLQCPVPN